MNTFHRIFLCCTMTVVAQVGVGALAIMPLVTRSANFETTSSVQLATAAGYGLTDDVAQKAGLPNKPLRDSVLGIVSWSLGFLGIIGVVLVVYAGFMWMTAAGNEDRIKKAKEIMTAAIIGIVIIILSFAVTFFIVSGIGGATTS